MNTMHGWQQTGPGGTDTLFWGELPRPRPGRGELLVRVKAAGINRADIVQREGRYPAPAGVTPVLGLEVAGEVVEVGEGAGTWQVGDAVFGLVAGGAYAEYVLLEAELALAKPESLDWAEAASLPEAWMTAWLNLVVLGGLTAGTRLLIHAGASGVGAAAIQLGRLFGAEAVYATAGGPHKTDFCRQLGATLALDYRTEPDFGARLKALGGVDLILDPVGADYLERNLSALRPDGRLVLIGLMGGANSTISLGTMLVKRLSLLGSTLRALPVERKMPLAQALRERVLPWLLAGQARLTIDRRFGFGELAAAHRYMEDNANLGKLVLVAP
ncbi:NAD(P)H-quinone oxidoreductase [Chitinimonas lacunae]|uniref:NAD(P)H-quinone oxidoreductase n=1 Tax=Chitinimonas lacunae TaxID=1963018 RepID=A0ABV8MI16_9NEIS